VAVCGSRSRWKGVGGEAGGGNPCTGDYSIVGQEHRIAIERKSVEDFLGSITAGNARFRREHERMACLAVGRMVSLAGSRP